jgi:hypothetical protein
MGQASDPWIIDEACGHRGDLRLQMWYSTCSECGGGRMGGLIVVEPDDAHRHLTVLRTVPFGPLDDPVESLAGFIARALAHLGVGFRAR